MFSSNQHRLWMQCFRGRPSPGDSVGKAAVTGPEKARRVVFSGPGIHQPHGSWASGAAQIHSCCGPGSGQPLGFMRSASCPYPTGVNTLQECGKPYRDRPAWGLLTAEAPPKVPISFRAKQCLVQNCSQMVTFSTYLKMKSSFCCSS